MDTNHEYGENLMSDTHAEQAEIRKPQSPQQSEHS
jgi:hypothetical protein